MHVPLREGYLDTGLAEGGIDRETQVAGDGQASINVAYVGSQLELERAITEVMEQDFGRGPGDDLLVLLGAA